MARGTFLLTIFFVSNKSYNILSCHSQSLSPIFHGIIFDRGCCKTILGTYFNFIFGLNIGSGKSMSERKRFLKCQCKLNCF